MKLDFGLKSEIRFRNLDDAWLYCVCSFQDGYSDWKMPERWDISRKTYPDYENSTAWNFWFDDDNNRNTWGFFAQPIRYV